MMRKTSAMTCGRTTVLLLLLCIVANTAAAQQRAEPQQTPASLPGAVIPVAEVAAHATEVTKLLRTLGEQIVPSH